MEDSPLESQVLMDGRRDEIKITTLYYWQIFYVLQNGLFVFYAYCVYKTFRIVFLFMCFCVWLLFIENLLIFDFFQSVRFLIILTRNLFSGILEIDSDFFFKTSRTPWCHPPFFSGNVSLCSAP